MASPLDIFRASMDGAERGRERGLAQLLGKAYSAPREQRSSILGQVASLGAPQAAFDAENHFRSMDDNARADFGRYAVAFDALPDAQKAVEYPNFARQAQQFGIPAPLEWKPEFAPNISKLAQALGGVSGQGIPAGVQEFQFLTQGLSPEDVAKARRIQLGLDGRASSAGFGFDTFTGSDGRERPTITDPRTGVTYIYDEAGRGYVPLGGARMGAGGFQPPQPGGNPFASLVAGVPGLQVNSTTRTPEHNAKVGGVPNSYHLTGQAIDIAPPGANGPAVRQWAAQNGMEVIDEGDHWHLEPRGNAPHVAQPGLGVGQTPQERKYAEESGTQAARIAALPEVGRIEAGNAALKKGAETTAENQAKFLADLPKVVAKADDALGLIDMALQHPGRGLVTGLSGAIDPRAYLPGGDAADFRAILEQLQGRSFLEAFESLKGGGQITQIEGEKATAAIARLKTNQSDEGFRKSLMDLRDVVMKARDRALQRAGTPNAIPVNDTSDDDLIGKYL